MPDKTGIDPADVVALFGAKYVDSGQSAADIFKKVQKTPKLEKEQFTAMQTSQTETVTQVADYQTHISAYPKDHKLVESDNKVSFKPFKWTLFHVEHQDQFVPNELIGTYNQFLAANKFENPEDTLFISWLFENHFLEQKLISFAHHELVNGVRVERTPNVAPPPGQAINGFKKIVNDLTTDGTIVPIVTPAWSTDPQTFVEQIMTFTDNVNNEFKQSSTAMTDIMFSGILYQRYLKGLRKIDPYYFTIRGPINLSEMESLPVVDTKFSVKGYSELDGSNKIYLTTKNNLVINYNFTKAPAYKVEVLQTRFVRFVIDYLVGLQINNPYNIITNNLA